MLIIDSQIIFGPAASPSGRNGKSHPSALESISHEYYPLRTTALFTYGGSRSRLTTARPSKRAVGCMRTNGSS
jgi:hypothetical protein